MTHRIRRLALVSSFMAFACAKADAGAARVASAQPEPSDQHYGVYLSGVKVGWMRARLEVGKTVDFRINLTAKVAGMGQVSEVTLSETRSYDARSGALLGLSFSQTAATGSVQIEGKAQDGKLQLTVHAGETKEQVLPVRETLADAMALTRLATSAKVGATATARRFDPSLQKDLNVRYRVVAAEKKLMDGVDVQTVKIEAHYPDLGITETSWLDGKGLLLESQVGGFFVARLEPPDVAKRLDYHQDLLVSAVVRPPAPLATPAALDRLRITFAGFGDTAPPASGRQQVQRAGATHVITLTRDTPPQATLPIQVNAALREYVSATPFIQSESPAIRETARRVAGDAKDVFTATTKLAEFVYAHVRDEYVPAYSNALEALESGRGDCTEHSILFVALARALGIPARVAVGIAYWPPGEGFGWHAWAEVYAAGSWYAVDPTWNQPVADSTHVKLADGGPAEQARIVMLLGQLKIEKIE
ncbi:MAG: transglutaminase domain-containing protein [Deltaproteobacteria bacterium]|nr:transglutaminase domain-containing protein [Deltaproteobacteria bacterium]